MTTIAVFNDKNHRYTFEPIEKDSSESTIEDGYLVIEGFKSMFVVDKSFCVRLKFRRFEDNYSIMSENILNDNLKDNSDKSSFQTSATGGSEGWPKV